MARVPSARSHRVRSQHYFYPDLPLGYQITQQFRPICTDGRVEVVLRDGAHRDVRIERLHIEQDSGKLMHEPGGSLLDLNRAGSALMEIVSAPDMRSADEAVAYVTKVMVRVRRPATSRLTALQVARLLQFIGTCDADLSRGNLRVDVNVSVARVETMAESLGVRCEIKNLNSLARMRDAIEYELQRHAAAMADGSPLTKETRGWDTKRKRTFSLRDKQSVLDYRYMRDPDLPPVWLTDADVASVRAELKETPAEKTTRYCSRYGLSLFDAEAMALDPHMSAYFEAAVSAAQRGASAGPALCNWITNELLGLMHSAGRFDMNEALVSPTQLASIVNAMDDGVLSGKLAKGVIRDMVQRTLDGKPALDAALLAQQEGLGVVRDAAALTELAAQVVRDNGPEAAAFAGADANRRQRLMRHFMGAAMKLSRGKADPEAIRSAIESVLNKRD